MSRRWWLREDHALDENKNMDLLQMSSAVATVTSWTRTNRELKARFMFREECQH